MARRINSQQVARALVIDVVLVLVFVLIGRVSHHEQVDVTGVSTTAWPFLVGLAAGWLVMRAWRSPFAVRFTGVGIFAITVVVGMLLRLASGQGVELPFVLIATVTLAILLLGWRLLAGVLARRRR